MKLKLKRDEESSSHPHVDQLEVGELVMNSVTGKLYSRLVDGTLVEWVSQKVCFAVAPVISFSHGVNEDVNSVNNFCCAGDILVATITGLRPESNVEYLYSFTELTENTNTSNIQVASPQYSLYEEDDPDDPDIKISYRKAIVPINLSIINTSNISIFRFTVSTNTNQKLVEKLITIKCYEYECNAVEL